MNVNTTLIRVRDGLVLAPDELPLHADDPDVAAILARDWPRLFEPEVEPPAQPAAPPGYRRCGSPPWMEP